MNGLRRRRGRYEDLYTALSRILSRYVPKGSLPQKKNILNKIAKRALEKIPDSDLKQTIKTQLSQSNRQNKQSTKHVISVLRANRDAFHDVFLELYNDRDRLLLSSFNISLIDDSYYEIVSQQLKDYFFGIVLEAIPNDSSSQLQYLRDRINNPSSDDEPSSVAGFSGDDMLNVSTSDILPP
jgi:hypothetical protein